MGRWLLILLLILNLGLLLWGWTHDRPLDPPLQPLPEAPGRILLPAEWAGRDVAVTSRPDADPPLPGPSPDVDEGPFDPDPKEGTGGEPLPEDSGAGPMAPLMSDDPPANEPSGPE